MPAWLSELSYQAEKCFCIFLHSTHQIKKHSHISRLSTTLSHVFCLSFRDYAPTYNTHTHDRWTMSYCKAEKAHAVRKKDQRLGLSWGMTSFHRLWRENRAKLYAILTFPLSQRRASYDMSAKLFKFTKEEEKTNLKKAIKVGNFQFAKWFWIILNSSRKKYRARLHQQPLIFGRWIMS